MGSPILRIAVITFAVSAGAVAIAAPAADANDTVPQQLGSVEAWNFAADELPQLALAQEALAAEQLMEIKLDVSAQATKADAAYDASAGKATELSRQALAVERNRIATAVMLGETPAEVTVATTGLTAASDTVAAEVKAWEEAEAARLAEEARKAEAARHSSGGSGRSSGSRSSAPTGDPKAYLDGIAASWGTWVEWGPTACGHGSTTRVSGCYTGGSYVMVSDAAWQSWSVAKGRGRNVVLHEISHLIIMRKCGTVYINDRFENVTDAYAVLIGASSHTGYGYTADDMAVAQSIQGGSCPNLPH